MSQPDALPSLCFVHVPKTAGTAVTETLRAVYGPQSLPAMTTLDYACYGADQLAAYRFYAGHAYRRDYTRLSEGTLLFTVMRDPVERAISLYRYYRTLDPAPMGDGFMREAVELARGRPLMEFIYSDSPFLIEHLRLGQIRQFLPDALLAEISHRQFLSRALRDAAIEAALAELARFDLVLSHEWLGLSFGRAMRHLGVDLGGRGLALANVSEGTVDVDRCDVRRAMVDINGAEFICYDFVLRRERDWLAADLARGEPGTGGPGTGGSGTGGSGTGGPGKGRPGQGKRHRSMAA